MAKRFGFLVLAEHPYGREMLAQLLAAGHVPAFLLEEDSDEAEVEREKFLERMHGFEIAPSFDELLAGRSIRRLRVPHHNGEACRALLAQERPDLIVLGGTRILKPFVIAAARDGCLNAHPGLLPHVRGSASVAWSIHRDLPVGCTCHFIDGTIDTGPIVSRREIPVRRGDSYEKLCWETVRLSGTLMTEAVGAWKGGNLRSTPQEPGGETHRNMPDELVRAVKRKLSEGRYARFAD